jgi:hypothetical protein
MKTEVDFVDGDYLVRITIPQNEFPGVDTYARFKDMMLVTFMPTLRAMLNSSEEADDE